MLASTYIKLLKTYPRDSKACLADDALFMPRQDCPTITFHREHVMRYNESYGRLLAFAGYVLEKDPSQICEFDLMREIQKGETKSVATTRWNTRAGKGKR